MILVLVGESASGKSTVADLLTKKDGSFSKVVTFTTRPIRVGERDGIDYHFISKETFDEFVDKSMFFEHASYREWDYGSAIDFDISENKVIILTPSGARALKRYVMNKPELKDKLLIVYLCVDRRSRMIKILQRGDNIDEAYRRNLSDVGQFDGFNGEADYTIKNENYCKSAEAICDIILDIIEGHYENK